jgi:hypothetical protein
MGNQEGNEEKGEVWKWCSIEKNVLCVGFVERDRSCSDIVGCGAVGCIYTETKSKFEQII